jgi:phosphatidylserine decarboxylase
MELQIVISSFALAFVFMWIQSLYWALPMRVWVTSALVIGLTTATAMTLITGWAPGLGMVLRILIEGVLVVITALAALMLFFFRDPERIPPEEDGVILSPADGQVIYVKKVEPGSHFVSIKAGTKYPLEELIQNPWPAQGGHLIGIEMNVMDVHVNRAPVAGRVTLCKEIKGGFPGLGKQNAEIRSQRAVTLIDAGNLTVAVVQIASRFVRGIVSYVKEGQEVAIGERIGMIRFGSQVDLAIPDAVDYAIAVEPGQVVRAGQTVLVRYGQGLRPESLKGRS